MQPWDEGSSTKAAFFGAFKVSELVPVLHNIMWWSAQVLLYISKAGASSFTNCMVVLRRKSYLTTGWNQACGKSIIFHGLNFLRRTTLLKPGTTLIKDITQSLNSVGYPQTCCAANQILYAIFCFLIDLSEISSALKHQKRCVYKMCFFVWLFYFI